MNDSLKEGGVKSCTDDYVRILSQIYELSIFPVRYELNYLQRLISKLQINAYNNYKPKKCRKLLLKTIEQKNIQFIFLNLSNTAGFAPLIRSYFGNKIKIVLCSHGNESGDYLHEALLNTTRFRLFISSIVLGRMLIKEALWRRDYLDGVFTVSDIEIALEKWIGAQKTLMIPRIINVQPVLWRPVLGRVGFVGDLRHLPNYSAIIKICDALENIRSQELEIRLVGISNGECERLAKEYRFVTYLGYLDSDALVKEVELWSLFINPVFYYSRGVSTKLSKALGWQLPVISTEIGCRGYEWGTHKIPIVSTPTEMANAIVMYSNDYTSLKEIRTSVQKICNSMPTVESVSKAVRTFLSE